jgi:hypothetical protein
LLEREIDGHTNIKNENPLPELFNYILSCSCAMVLFLGSRAGMLALVGTIAVVIIIIRNRRNGRSNPPRGKYWELQAMAFSECRLIFKK